MAAPVEQKKAVAYVAPALMVLGKAHTLTQGPTPGPNADGIFLLHTSV